MNPFFSDMTTTSKVISWLTFVLSIGYAILLVQPQPELNRVEIHTAAANYMGISLTTTSNNLGPTHPLTGLTVAITGATSGIGLELTRKLSSMGAHVVAIGRSSEKLKTLAKEVEHVTTILADLTDLDSVARAADEISNNVPQLDILVNNAGMHLGLGEGGWPWQQHPSTVQGYDLVFGGTYAYN
jgi:NADPH:quinone reductase-like Zn-dependent oxidoreductase